MEKSAAIGTMLSSITHEMNTPIGVSLTAVTHLQRLRNESLSAFEGNNLKRSQLTRFYQDCEEACTIAERNLARASSIVSTFKQLNSDQYSEETRSIHLTSYVCELLLSLKPTLKQTQHKVCINIDPDLHIDSYPSAIGQILINLIINSVKHGFENTSNGHIFIAAQVEKNGRRNELVLKYADNGKGMDESTKNSIYRPFFTQARHKGGTGLGMHICYNLAVNMLQGSIQCESKENEGTRFTIRFPVMRNLGFL